MTHPSHPDIIKRLKRAEGHLRALIAMMEEGRPCLDLAQQLHAVENAVANAKRELIHEHIDRCLTEAVDGNSRVSRQAFVEFKAITKYL
jgi:DNA-binding FrmR family transcriptional regulator